MKITIHPDVEEFLLHDREERPETTVYHANQYSRQFHQMLLELEHAVWREGDVVLCEAIAVERARAFEVGGDHFDLLAFTLERTGYAPKQVLIDAMSTQARHPNDPTILLFRGEHVIDVLRKAAAMPWVPESKGAR